MVGAFIDGKLRAKDNWARRRFGILLEMRSKNVFGWVDEFFWVVETYVT